MRAFSGIIAYALIILIAVIVMIQEHYKRKKNSENPLH